MNTKTYNSVEDMVRDLNGPEAVEGMQQHAEATRTAWALALARNNRGLTQRQLADRMKCSPSKVCRIEDAADADLRLGDIIAYTAALDVQATLSFEEPGMSASDRIKNHVMQIKQHLDSLAAIAGKQNDDRELVRKIHQFYGEVLFNFLLGFGDSCRKLPDIVVAAPAVPSPAATENKERNLAPAVA